MGRLPAALMVLLAVAAAGVRAAGSEYRPVAGWPAGVPAPLGYGTAAVSAVAVSPRGEVFVFQRTAHPVLVFSRDGRFRRAWGEELFTNPHGCRFDPQGNLWLLDNADHRVMQFSPEGELLKTLGEKGKAGEDAGHFNRPTDIAFAPSGDFYVSDGYGNSRVVRFSRDGKYLGAWGRKGSGEGEFNLPHSVAVDTSGRVYVADRENARIQLFTPEGKFLEQWRDVGHPYGLFLTPDQTLFVSDGIAGTVSAYDLKGRRLASFGASGEMALPHLIAVDSAGAVYVAEVDGKRIRKWVRR